jgi:hypothetical protein
MNEIFQGAGPDHTNSKERKWENSNRSLRKAYARLYSGLMKRE